MKAIYKYTLSPDETTVQLPKGAKLLSAGYQMDGHQVEVRLWALVDTEAPLEAREIFVFGTGQFVPQALVDGLQLLDTVNIHPIGIVLHIFYR